MQKTEKTNENVEQQEPISVSQVIEKSNSTKRSITTIYRTTNARI